MTEYIVRSLFKAYAACIVTGILLSMMLVLGEEYLSFSSVFGGTLIGSIISGIFSAAYCILFLLPISLMEKSVIEENNFIYLLKRYLPLIVLPVALLFCIVVYLEYCTANPSVYPFYVFSSVLLIGYVGLWTFLKAIKS
jgi:hypothetical protein